MRGEVPERLRQAASALPGVSSFARRRDESLQNNPFVLPRDAAPSTVNPFAPPIVDPFSQAVFRPAADVYATGVSMSAPPQHEVPGYAPAPVVRNIPAMPAYAPPSGTGVPLPVAVRVAYVALLAAAASAALLSAVGVYALIELRDSFDKMLHVDPTGTALFYAADYADNAELALIGVATMLGVLFAITYVLVARAIRKGNSWPRPVGTALAVMSLPAIALGPVAIVAVFAGIVAVAATWMPSARQYATAARARRRA